MILMEHLIQLLEYILWLLFIFRLLLDQLPEYTSFHL